jgi:hypothetical protein
MDAISRATSLATWAQDGTVVIHCGTRQIDWLQLATVGSDEHSAYEIHALEPASGMILRRRQESISVSLPDVIEIHVVPDTNETLFGMRHGLFDVAMEVEPTAVGADDWAGVELVSRSSWPRAIQAVRWSQSRDERVNEVARRLQNAIDLNQIAADIYGPFARPGKMKCEVLVGARDMPRLHIRLGYNIENPLRAAAVMWLAKAAQDANVDIIPVPACWAEIHREDFSARADGVLLTRSDDEPRTRREVPDWHLTSHVDLLTATSSEGAAQLALGCSTVFRAIDVLAGNRWSAENKEVICQ